MRQIKNKDFKKFKLGKMDYKFSYNLYKKFPREHKSLTDEVAKDLDGIVVRITRRNTLKGSLPGGYLVPPEWCYPIKYSSENRYMRWMKSKEYRVK